MINENHETLVSVIMNCRNSDRFLEEAIKSVFAQTYSNWEIIFYDNLSTDKSPEIANRFIGKLKYFRGSVPLSLGEARNEAIKHASGKYIAILDCDDLWYPEKLEKQVGLIEKNPEAVLVYSNCHFINENGESIKPILIPRKPPENVSPAFSLISERCFIPCPTIMLKMESIKKVGGFDNRYHFAEEYDLCVKAALTGKINYIDEPLASYRIHGSNASIAGVADLFEETILVMKNAAKQIHHLTIIEKIKLNYRFVFLRLLIVWIKFKIFIKIN
jgi:glycosyltransferase involved in cell wall biosynthesis